MVKKKIIPNTLYTLGIVLSLILGYQYGIEQRQYVFLFGAVVIMATFIMLKIRLYKEMKESFKKP